MRTFVLAVLLSAVPAMAADIHTFSLLSEDGAIAGLAGSTIGWGYSIENESTTLWLVTSTLNSGSFDHGTPDLLFDFPILAPGQTVTVPFNAVTSTGLQSLTWDPSAPLGFVNSGAFVLGSEWWTGDPFAGGSLQSPAPTQTAFYNATVSAVPEPGTTGLAALSLLLLGVTRAFRRRKQFCTS